MISFYFIPLKKFGLTENLYIRMNARGKMLTGFENFKSEFYKYISKFNVLLEEVKDKIEYAWVENLWDYRENDTFVVDKPFMQYLGFITEMLYYKNAKFRAVSYETDFLDLKVLKEIYSKEENLKFLIFSLDIIKKLKGHNNHNILWSETTTVHHILESILSGKRDITQLVILYSALCYFYSGKKEDNFYDFIRVVRNLFHNTADKSRREWPKLLKSISNLIRDENVYNILKDDKADDLLDGFYVPQKKEEIVKAKLMDLHPGIKNILFDVEDNTYLKGNIAVLLISNFISSEEEFDGFDLMSADLPSFNIKNFSSTFESYKAISVWNFSIVWGDTIISAFYSLSGGSRLTCGGNYAKHPSIITLVMEFDEYRLKSTLEDFLKLKEKQFISNLLTRHADLSTVTNVKEQLYLYYILHKRVLGKSNSTFFKKGYNFGWLPKEKGFSSIFGSRIENDPSFTTTNPIFQTFDSRFRYNCGLRTENALDEEIVGNGRKHNPFELLIQWAED